MPTRNLETRLSISGEKEYKAKLGEVNKDLAVLNSEMKLVTARFKDNATSVEALSAKQEILNKKYDIQKQKVETIRAQLKKSADALGENDAKTKDLQISLNNAEAALESMTQELDSNREALDRANQEADEGKSAWERLRDCFRKTDEDSEGLGDALGGLSGKLGIDLPDGVTKAINGLGTLSASSIAVAGVVAGLAAALAGVEKKLIDMTVEASAWADEVLNAASVSGVSGEALQEYGYVADRTGISIENIQDALKETTNSIKSATEGASEQVEAFEQLGVSYKNADGSLRDSEDVFNDVIGVLSEMSAGTERDILAMTLLSESAQQLNPLINAGAEKIDALTKEAHEMGKVLDEESLIALDNVDSAMKDFHDTIDGTKKQLSAEFAPSMERVLEKMTGGISDVGEALKRSGLVSAFGMLLETVVDIIFPADQLADDVVPKLTKALRPLAEIIAGIADTMDFISSLLKLDFKGAFKAAGFGYSYGNGNNLQTLFEEWEQTDISAATAAAGYGQYYSDGKWYDYGRYKEIEAKKEEQRKIYESAVKLNPQAYGGESFEDYWREYASRNGWNAGGTQNWRGGWTWVGENGPELAYLPRGTAVVTAQESQGGGDVYYITISAKDVKEFNDVVRLAKSQRRKDRMNEG